VKLPPNMKKRGRPKGIEKTVISLPCHKKTCSDKPMAFLKKQPVDRERGIRTVVEALISCCTDPTKCSPPVKQNVTINPYSKCYLSDAFNQGFILIVGPPTIIMYS